MSRRAFDPTNATLPLDLPAVPFPITTALCEHWIAGLGGKAPAVRELMERGQAPPFALTGCTIFLISSHYDIAGGVYWREQVTCHRPPRIGETLSVSGAVERVYVHDGRRYQQMASRSVDAEGRPVASSRSTGLSQYRRAETTPAGEEGQPDESTAPGPDFAAAQANPCLAALRALTPGQAIGGDTQPVTLQMMRDLSAGDERNPIHTDPEVARAAGLKAPIAGGPHVLAFLQEAMLESLGAEALSHGAHFDVRWVSPVFAGDMVATRATVSDVRSDRLDFELRVESDGRTAMIGTAVVPLGVSR